MNQHNRKTLPSLRKRLMLGLLGYVALLSVAVALHGLLVNERAEQLVWQTMLTAELDHLEERIARDPNYRWADTSDMALYDSRIPPGIPKSLAKLLPGVHDGILIDGQERVVLVRQEGSRRVVLTLDISDIEAREQDMTLTVIGSALTLLVLLGAFTAWGASRLVEPLALMARRISELRPDQQGRRLQVPDGATVELEVIGRALNDYLARNDRFVERERIFIDMASHELRTPVAVIGGASELALKSAEVPASTRVLLERIRGTAKGVQELINLLLVLAKDPARLPDSSVRISLGEILPAIVDDHRHLTQGKDLVIELDAPRPVEVAAPPQIVRAAIGNLLRNAIENSDRGAIVVSAQAPATVTILDPGHGMTEDEIGEVYSRMARGGGDRGGSGIGLDLIARLCEHLSWKLSISSIAGGGTAATLVFGPGSEQSGGAYTARGG